MKVYIGRFEYDNAKLVAVGEAEDYILCLNPDSYEFESIKVTLDNAEPLAKWFAAYEANGCGFPDLFGDPVETCEGRVRGADADTYLANRFDDYRLIYESGLL